MTSRHKERAKLRRRSQLKGRELLPEDFDYRAKDWLKDPFMTPVELIILWRLGHARPSALVVLVVTLPFVLGVTASVIGLLLRDYIFLIPLAIHIAILILLITPMLLESRRTHLSIGTIASLKSRDRSRQINMGLIAVAIVTVLLLFMLIDSGAFENGARPQITVQSNHIYDINYVVYIDSSLVESGILEPHDSTTFNYVYRWSLSEPTNLTISVEWGLLTFEPSFSSSEVITVAHGGFYAVDLRI